MVSFGGEDGSAIITDRNKKALVVLKKEIADGKKKIGIFYGAGHLSDMDKRLRQGQEGGCGQGHKDSTDGDGHGAATASQSAIAGTDSMAHGDGCRGRNPQGHHIGKAGRIQDDLMRREDVR